MASMKDWLGFSQSPQELPPSQLRQSSTHPLIVMLCPPNLHRLLPLASQSSGQMARLASWKPSTDLTLIPKFGLKGSSSELSILVGSSSNQNNMDHDEPKLKDFLGGNSFSDHDQKLPPGCSSIPGTYNNSSDYMFSNDSLQLPAAASMASNGGINGGNMNNNGTGCSTNSIDRALNVNDKR